MIPPFYDRCGRYLCRKLLRLPHPLPLVNDLLTPQHHKQESVPNSGSAGISIDPSFLSEPIPVNRTAQAVQDINGYQLYGLDAELEMKRRDKRDPNREIHAMQWIAAILDEPETPSFPDSLRSGILLCRCVVYCPTCLYLTLSNRLLNSIFPNRITKIDTRPIPLVERVRTPPATTRAPPHMHSPSHTGKHRQVPWRLPRCRDEYSRSV